ncbi:MAG: hypothetical protein QXP59_03865 [Saccharolobus sp.]
MKNFKLSSQEQRKLLLEDIDKEIDYAKLQINQLKKKKLYTKSSVEILVNIIYNFQNIIEDLTELYNLAK